MAGERLHRLSCLTQNAIDNWYIYFDAIPAQRIDAELPATVMLQCLDDHIATLANADTRKRFKVLRAYVATLSPDLLARFRLVDNP